MLKDTWGEGFLELAVLYLSVMAILIALAVGGISLILWVVKVLFF